MPNVLRIGTNKCASCDFHAWGKCVFVLILVVFEVLPIWLEQNFTEYLDSDEEIEVHKNTFPVFPSLVHLSTK
jgi:hypothetical protein